MGAKMSELIFKPYQSYSEFLYGKEGVKVPDPSNPIFSPNHYNSGSLECIDAIEASMSRDEFLGYLKGNTMKYLWRYRYKGKPEEDLKKAQWYLDKLTTTYTKGDNAND